MVGDIMTLIRSVSGESVPTGIILPHGGPPASIPAGFLPCDGAAVSRTTYAALFAVLGTVWGIGDGSTTFNVPDFRARSPLGMNDATFGQGLAGGRTARPLAQTPGNETHSHTSSTGNAGAHTHLAGSIVGGGLEQAFANSRATDDPGNHAHSIPGDSLISPSAVCPYVIKT